MSQSSLFVVLKSSDIAAHTEETDEKQPVMSTGNYSTLKEGAINSCFLLSIGSQSLDRRPDASE
ncbi:hypothetical protein CRH03_00330 [Clostridium sp. HMb25]|nr:hypothetical protein CRH03_00330 [Clostridium sp. HMb25]RGY60506.1 hypothetical protein DXA34_08395 [[Clostridium] symbiosum]RHB61117.1 hypothetical protein DW877_14035 [[Clostridium] symbiosum]